MSVKIHRKNFIEHSFIKHQKYSMFMKQFLNFTHISLNPAFLQSGNNTTPDPTAVTPGQTPAPTPTATPTPPPKKRGRPKGSKNKPCLITSPQQLLDLRTAYPESSPIWAGMPDCKQAQIAAVLSGLNHKLFRQNPSFTV